MGETLIPFGFGDTGTVKTLSLQLVRLEEFLLTHEEVTLKQPKTQNTNYQGFYKDMTSGEISRYSGTFVAYTKGVFCGQSKHSKTLFRDATTYFGEANTAVFEVPNVSKHAFNDYVEAEVKRTALGKID